MIDPRLLAFEAVLQEGSFERAARRLALTQSAVSQRVKLLEAELGQVLLVRLLQVLSRLRARPRRRPARRAAAVRAEGASRSEAAEAGPAEASGGPAGGGPAPSGEGRASCRGEGGQGRPKPGTDSSEGTPSDFRLSSRVTAATASNAEKSPAAAESHHGGSGALGRRS